MLPLIPRRLTALLSSSAVVLAFGFASAWALPSAQADDPVATFSASIAPPEVQVGADTQYSLEIANTSPTDSGLDLGSMQLVVPALFTDLVLPDDFPDGWTLSTPGTCSVESPDGCGVDGSTLIQATINDGSDLLGPQQSISFTFDVHASAKGNDAWNTAAFSSTTYGDGTPLELDAVPAVHVYGTPAQLAIVTNPTEPTAGEPFDVAVNVLDSGGEPTLSNANVNLSASFDGHPVSLDGTDSTNPVQVAADHGTAQFTGLTLTKAGSIDLTATSGDLTKAGSVTVHAGPPDHLVVGSPVCPIDQTACGIRGAGEVRAGEDFAVSITVEDEFKNPVESDQAGTIDRAVLGDVTAGSVPFNTGDDGSPSDGTITKTLTAPQKVGTYHYTVTAASLPTKSVSFDIAVVPGPPDRIAVTAPLCPVTGDPPPCSGIESNGDVRVGRDFAALIEVQDQYANDVDSVQPVIVKLGGHTEVTTDTNAGGTALVGLTAPTVAALGATPAQDGTGYTYTASSHSLMHDFGVNVVPGPPEKLTVDTVTDPANPGFLARNSPFNVTVSARDHYGNQTRFSQLVSLSTSGGTPASNLGSLSAASYMFANEATHTFAGVLYNGYGNNITLRAHASVLTDGTKSIDVNLYVTTKSATPGTPTTITNANCTNATPQVPVCGSLILNRGASGNVVTTQGACFPIIDCLQGTAKSTLYLDALANLTNNGSPLYTNKQPAIMELRCDKTLCGGKSTSSYPLTFQPTNGVFTPVPSCPKKGQIGLNQTFCQDLVSTKRDNAGDLITYLLFLDDAKASFKP